MNERLIMGARQSGLRISVGSQNQCQLARCVQASLASVGNLPFRPCNRSTHEVLRYFQIINVVGSQNTQKVRGRWPCSAAASVLQAGRLVVHSCGTHLSSYERNGKPAPSGSASHPIRNAPGGQRPSVGVCPGHAPTIAVAVIRVTYHVAVGSHRANAVAPHLPNGLVALPVWVVHRRLPRDTHGQMHQRQRRHRSWWIGSR